MWVGGEDYCTGVVVGLCLDPPDKPRAPTFNAACYITPIDLAEHTQMHCKIVYPSVYLAFSYPWCAFVRRMQVSFQPPNLRVRAPVIFCACPWREGGADWVI